MWHTVNLPINFFSARQAEDIAIRKKENESIAEVFVDALAPTVINIFLMLIYLILMLKYSIMLSLIGIFSVMVNVVVNQIISTHSKTHKYEKIKGNIEIKNVTFGYSALEKPLIKNFSLKIEQGKK